MPSEVASERLEQEYNFTYSKNTCFSYNAIFQDFVPSLGLFFNVKLKIIKLDSLTKVFCKTVYLLCSRTLDGLLFFFFFFLVFYKQSCSWMKYCSFHVSISHLPIHIKECLPSCVHRGCYNKEWISKNIRPEIQLSIMWRFSIRELAQGCQYGCSDETLQNDSSPSGEWIVIKICLYIVISMTI